MHSNGPPLSVIVVATSALYWDALVHFGNRVIGLAGDGSSYAWLLWHFTNSHGSFFHKFTTNQVFFPVGVDLRAAAPTPLIFVLSWPLVRVLGLAGTMTFWHVFATLSTGVVAYFLSMRLTSHRAAALFAGLAVAFLPYRINQQNHYNLIHTEVVLFGILAMLRLYDKPSARRAAVLALAVVTSVYTDSYYAVFLVLSLVTIAIVNHKATFKNPIFVKLVSSTLVACVFTSPYFIAIFQNVEKGEVVQLPRFAGSQFYSANVASWFMPSLQHRLWGKAMP